MKDPASRTLETAGASLFYEVQGDGPLLLMMPGGPADGRVFSNIAPILAARFTVLTYDPRGVSRTTVDLEPEEGRIVEILADDAERLIAAAGGGPAFILGNSGGAVVGLDLAARYPQRVRVLVAHEPPCAALQPDPAQALEAAKAVVDTYRNEGVGPGMQKFMAMVRGGTPGPAQQGPQGAAAKPRTEPAPPTPEARKAAEQGQRTAEFFLEHVIFGLAAYQPRISALKGGAPRVIAGVGAESKGQVAHQGGLELARQLGSPAVIFPGGHGGFMTHAEEFARVLTQALGVP